MFISRHVYCSSGLFISVKRFPDPPTSSIELNDFFEKIKSENFLWWSNHFGVLNVLLWAVPYNTDGSIKVVNCTHEHSLHILKFWSVRISVLYSCVESGCAIVIGKCFRQKNGRKFPVHSTHCSLSIILFQYIVILYVITDKYKIEHIILYSMNIE